MSDPALLTITVDDQAATAVVSVIGQLDFGTTPELLRAADAVVSSGRAVVLDLGEVSFCDSSGLSALVRLHKAAVAAGGALTLARLRPQVAATISATALDRLFTIADEVPGR
ncbi:STAS domain-containing protein [Actinokineospora diospyrosa]|uniref:Anti-sigma factor antagonist n=1 Tax=Actinokineospora diospyrosa TaxID=103728 RepID=A0ABT1IFA5_9PSEU|nr:STAS domain-containing protein [Actinokineospora diospyrosa]MCP2271332.1 anti-sigma B factor antagonist [Actinokineospora diospyrosa]